jgi:hypothetical protein
MFCGLCFTHLEMASVVWQCFSEGGIWKKTIRQRTESIAAIRCMKRNKSERFLSPWIVSFHLIRGFWKVKEEKTPS